MKNPAGNPVAIAKGRQFAFHTPLFAAFPIVSIYSANLSIIPFPDLWRPLSIVVAGSLLVWLICAAIWRNWSRGATAASLICISLTLYSPITKTLTWLDAIYVWIPLVIGIGFVLARLIKSPYVLNVLATVLTVVSFSSIGLGEYRARSDVSKIVSDTPAGEARALGTLPDIFYIILDGYGRSDMLKRVMNYDNSSFIQALKQRGFYVAPYSHSNYVQTEISLSSSLNIDLIPDLLPHMPRSSPDRNTFDHLINDSKVARFLRDRGYRTYAISSGFPALKFNLSDVWLRQASNLSLFETTLIQLTPFLNTDQVTESQYVWRRSAILGALENVQSLAEPSSRPKFVFVHVLAPHPPFVFGPKGEAVIHHGPYGYWDGSDYMYYSGSPKTYRDGYVGQVSYLNQPILTALDKLMAGKTKPIILVQGDHGSKLRLDQNDLSKTDVTECFENLSAYYVPDSVKSKLYPSVTPVNSFRILFSNLFGAKLPNLPDKSWYSPFAHPFEFTDVTNRIEQIPKEGSHSL